jgi:hypothetical protein
MSWWSKNFLPDLVNARCAPRRLGLNPDESEQGSPADDLPDPRFSYAHLTPAERAEFESWLDERNASLPMPEPTTQGELFNKDE